MFIQNYCNIACFVRNFSLPFLLFGEVRNLPYPPGGCPEGYRSVDDD
jgi:hypothetical protein